MSKAPEKIFVAEAIGTEVGLFGLWTDKDHRDTPYCEYIRKDAFLEWAKECTDSFNEEMEKLKPTDIAYRILSGGVSTIELLLNKINSL